MKSARAAVCRSDHTYQNKTFFFVGFLTFSPSSATMGNLTREVTMIRNILLSGAAIALMGVGAQAADIIEPVAFDWTGPYIGIQGGYAWGSNDVEVDSNLDILVGRAADDVVLIPPEDGEIDIDGWVGGLHLGYLWQHDSLVLGIEGDGEFADIDGDTDVFLTPLPDSRPFGEVEQEIDWLASLRLRAGFTWDRTLIYATGGLAVGRVELSADLDDIGSESESDTEWGWTIGGGLEHAFTDSLSARIEYRYTDLGNTHVRVENEMAGSVDLDADNAFHAVRLGLSWHFDSM
jgi:outer membrane immunogenic protein